MKTNGITMNCLVRDISHFRKAVTVEYRTMWKQCLARENEEAWRKTCLSPTLSTKSLHAFTRPEAEVRHQILNLLSYSTAHLQRFISVFENDGKWTHILSDSPMVKSRGSSVVQKVLPSIMPICALAGWWRSRCFLGGIMSCRTSLCGSITSVTVLFWIRAKTSKECIAWGMLHVILPLTEHTTLQKNNIYPTQRLYKL
jgi:hypothetical protein